MGHNWSANQFIWIWLLKFIVCMIIYVIFEVDICCSVSHVMFIRKTFCNIIVSVFNSSNIKFVIWKWQQSSRLGCMFFASFSSQHQGLASWWRLGSKECARIPFKALDSCKWTMKLIPLVSRSKCLCVFYHLNWINETKTRYYDVTFELGNWGAIESDKVWM